MSINFQHLVRPLLNSAKDNNGETQTPGCPLNFSEVLNNKNH